MYASKSEGRPRLCESPGLRFVTSRRTDGPLSAGLVRHPLLVCVRPEAKGYEGPILTSMDDEHRASDFIPLLLFYWLTVQDGREYLVNQLAIRWPELGCSDPLVDNALRRGVVAEVDPVQAVDHVRCQLI